MCHFEMCILCYATVCQAETSPNQRPCQSSLQWVVTNIYPQNVLFIVQWGHSTDKTNPTKDLATFPLSMRVWCLRLSMNLHILHIIRTGPSVPISGVPLCTSQEGSPTYLFIHVTVGVHIVLVLTNDSSWIMLMVLIWRSTILSGYLCLLPCTIPLNTDISLPRLTGHFQ